MAYDEVLARQIHALLGGKTGLDDERLRLWGERGVAHVRTLPR